MGREARVEKLRVCQVCGSNHYMNVKDFLQHVDLCKRAKEIGLWVPGNLFGANGKRLK